MAKSDRATVYVHFFGIELELPRHGDGGDGESFIQLDEVDILIPVPAGFRQKFFHGIYWRHHHPLGLDAANGFRDNPRDPLFAEPRSIPLARNNPRPGAVVGASRLPPGARAVSFY